MRIKGLALSAFVALAAFSPNFEAFSFAADDAKNEKIAKIAAELCRDGGGDWARCVEIAVSNRTKIDWEDQIVEIPIAGTPENPVENALSVVGERAESLRFCDAEGVEYVFNVADAEGAPIFRGVLGDGATLTIPASVAAGATAKYFVFFRNDAAFPNPDRFERSRKKAANLDFESGANGVVDAWKFDAPEANRTLFWSDERPFSGEKCLCCEVEPGAEPSWIAARQGGIAVEPGAKYRFEASVRGENVDGTAGWFLHLGNAENSMLTSPVIGISDKSDFDWTRLTEEFVVPENADRLEFGTVLRGTGTAWYDAVSLVRIDADAAEGATQVEVGKPFAIDVPPTLYPSSATGAKLGSETFVPKKLGIDPDSRFALIRIDAPNADGERLVRLDLRSFAVRWGRELGPNDFEILDLRGRAVPVEFFDDAVFFSAQVAAGARNCFVVVEKNAAKNAVADDFDLSGVRLDDAKKATKKRGLKTQNVANQAFPGTTLQTTNAERVDENASGAADVDEKSLLLPSFLVERNLLKDGDFENFDAATGLPKGDSAWGRDANEKGVDYSLVDPKVGALGETAIQMTVGDDAALKWRGWRRRVALEPNRTYCFGVATSSEPGSDAFDLHFHQRRDGGELASGGMGSLGKQTPGGSAWSLKCGSLRTTSDADYVEFHLTSAGRGTFRFDSLFIAPVDLATPIAFLGGKNGVFQVPAVVKVFGDTTFRSDAIEVGENSPATVALALGEEETMQFAIRAEKDAVVSVDATAPTLVSGAKNAASVALEKPEIFAVGRVVVDYPSSYYNTQGSETSRKFPKSLPATDGWIGYWPDPLIPIGSNGGKFAVDEKVANASADERSTWNDSQNLAADGAKGVLRLTADETRAVWLRFKTTAQTVPGVYSGTLTLRGADGSARVLPYSVEVLAFEAPETKIAAIYDARVAKDYFGDGSYASKIDKIAEKLLDRKLSSDSVPAGLSIRYDKATGTASADWTAFDKAATRYFDELGAKVAYTPGDFYCFGWGMPPKVVEGEKPYPGEYPYEGANRLILRPEYKKAYQAKLKLFWDHLKEKGWDDNFVLYISDEPFYSNPEIVAQMKALCDMIHEVDPKIPIYCSTWIFVPEWLGYLDVWGVGHYGGVSAASLKKIRDAGGRIWWTTDGQMCLDTPLCAVERLLPYTCVAWGAETYEFWGASWYTCNPFDSASHLYISQSDQPGVRYYVRYPNGDGYIFYPGDLVGLKGEILDSIRSEQAREGVEDAAWLVGLRDAIAAKTAPNSPERAAAQAVLDRATTYLPLECGSGRYSTRYMPDPAEFERIRLDVGKALEALTAK